MKQILISIKPKWVAKILSGEKTLEIRKTAPKEWVDYLNGKTDKKPEPMIVNIYCTKGDYIGHLSNKYVGKVGAKFTLKDVYAIYNEALIEQNDTIDSNYFAGRKIDYFWVKQISDLALLRDSFLFERELDEYLKGKIGYALKISDLETFDEPKELSEFYSFKCKQKKRPCYVKDVFGFEECHRICKLCEPLTKAPESWCYVGEEE